MPEHPPTPMVYHCRTNQKHAHRTRKGIVYRNDRYEVYRCPVCGRIAPRQPLPIICRGQPEPEDTP